MQPYRNTVIRLTNFTSLIDDSLNDVRKSHNLAYADPMHLASLYECLLLHDIMC